MNTLVFHLQLTSFRELTALVCSPEEQCLLSDLGGVTWRGGHFHNGCGVWWLDLSVSSCSSDFIGPRGFEGALNHVGIFHAEAPSCGLWVLGLVLPLSAAVHMGCVLGSLLSLWCLAGGTSLCPSLWASFPGLELY